MDIKFGTDGWRAQMGREFSFANVRRVAQAVAEHLKEEAAKTPRKKGGQVAGPVWIGYDKRFQSDAFAREIAKIMTGNKIPATLFAESLPTPALSLMTSRTETVGIMVTASHNPPAYNGIKIKFAGRAAPEALTGAVEAHIDKTPPVDADGYKVKSCRPEYLSYLKSRVNIPKIAASLKRPVVIDYLYGAASGLMEEILPEKKLSILHSRHDPLFGGLNPEPIEANLAALKTRILEEKAPLGIALDGDADRIGLMDGQGNYYTPCQVFPMIIEYLIEKKKISGKIVQSVSMGYLSERIARARNLPFEELPVGFKHVAEQVASGEAAIAGEESGGYAWKGGMPERDGLLAALLVLEMCAVLGKPLAQVWKDIEKTYGKSYFQRVDYKLHKPAADKAVFAAKLTKKLPKKVLGTEIKEVKPLDGLKIILADDHWLLMRPSGTEPLMRVYAESDSPKRTVELLELAKKWSGAGAQS